MQQIVVIDHSVSDQQAFVAALPADVEILYLSPESDGLSQISKFLDSRLNIDTLHVISHGAPGMIQLGSSVINTDSLNKSEELWVSIGQSLSTDGDILLYGCSVALGDAGLDFMARLARITSANIIASVNTTGAESSGGDWVLEKSTSPLSVDVPTLEFSVWSGVLPMMSTPIAQQLPGHTAGEFENGGAFALLLSNGSVVTWGSSNFGGDKSSAIENLRSGVQQIFSNYSAFSALKSDGSVVTWGDIYNGGDSSAVAIELSNGVLHVFSTFEAFAALKSDGSVVTWGDSACGGDSSAVAVQLSSGVRQIFSNDRAFAALKNDGNVITWGSSEYGGDSDAVAIELSSDVQQIFSTYKAFAALRSDGSVVTWGDGDNGGDSSSVVAQLSSGVQRIYSSGWAFAALKNNGSVVTWGNAYKGGDSSSVVAQLSSGVQQIFSTNTAFAALKSDGSVVTWGDGDMGGDSGSVTTQLSSGVQQIFSTEDAFAALKNDGSVVTWGNAYNGGDSSSVFDQLSSGVQQIYSSGGAFAALKNDGSVVTWGNAYKGGDSSSVVVQLSSDVQQIFSTWAAFAALKNDGSIVAWGDGDKGGDSSFAQGQLFDVVGAANIYTDDKYTVPGEIWGTDGEDILVGTPMSEHIYGLTGNDSLTGNSGDDTFVGSFGNDSMVGGLGKDNFIGGMGQDSMIGGAGEDRFWIYAPAELTGDVINGGQEVGTRERLRLVSQEKGQIFDLGFASSIRYIDSLDFVSDVLGIKLIIGHTIAATADNDKNGVLGDIRIAFRDGNDINEAMTCAVFIDGREMTESQSLYFEGDGYKDGEVYFAGFAGNDTIYGGRGRDTFFGGAGNDTLNGGSGSDSLVGGIGNDSYYVEFAGDIVIEAVDAGVDTVFSYQGAYTLPANIENGRIMSTSTANLAGNALNNTLHASVGNNALQGGAGVDTVSYAYGVSGTSGVTVNLGVTSAQATGGSGSDTLASIENLTGSAYADRLTGNSGRNVLSGGLGNDTLNGGGGSDYMVGGTGNDSYYVELAGDIVIEAVDAGVDTVFSYQGAYTLPANIENGRIMSTSTAKLAGNALNNTLHASIGNNALQGGAGVDTVSYAYGVSGTSGVTVNLGVTSAQATGGSGSDTLVSIENLTGSAYADRLTGNSGRNVLNGGLGNDTLSGGTGSDSLVGGNGNDTYQIDNAGDIVTESSDAVSGGIDTVISTVSRTLGSYQENLTLAGLAVINGTGNTLANKLTGNSANNILIGFAGNDTLNGGLGNDTLRGGAGSDSMAGGTGNDSFTFDTALGSSNIDIVSDFVHGTDKIVLDDDIFTKIGASGTLLASAFRKGAGVTTAGDVDDRIILNTTTGALYYDANGNAAGVAVHFATITGATSTKTTMTASDFLVVV